MKIGKMLLSIIIFIPLIASAIDNGIANIKIFKNASQPGDGVQVVPSLSMASSNIEHEKLLSRLNELKDNGYVNQESDYAQFLFSVAKRSSKEIKDNKNNGQYDSHLKQDISEIKLAFNYKGISFLKKENIIGFAAVGGWDETNHGWTGVVEFFYDKELGICSLNVFNTELSKGSSIIAKESARYDINDMPNVLSVEGNKHSGFLYHITFYQKYYWKFLECANKVYDPIKTKKLIELTRRIDKENN